MNTTPLHRRAIRDYEEVCRMAIHATEREAFVTTKSGEISSKLVDAAQPEPCNFCASEDVPSTDRFAELRADLGPYWLVWLIAISVVVVAAVLAAVALIYVSWVQ